MPVPTFELENVKSGLPPKLTISPVIRPDKLAVPVAVADVMLSYTLSSPVRPVMVNDLVVISKVTCFVPL